MEPTILSFLIGARLGLRFNVLILAAVIGLALLGTAAVGIVHGDRIGSVVLTTVLVASAVQIGCFATIVTRAALASIRVPNVGPRGLSRMRVVSIVLACSKVSTFRTTWKWWVQMTSTSARLTTRKAPTVLF